MRLAGKEFTVENLAPFGERWVPTEGGLFVDKWLKQNLPEIVQAVRKAKLAVLQNTQIGANWEKRPVNPRDEIPHIDNDPSVANTIGVVQILHAEGPRGPTGYSKHPYLELAAQSHADLLKQAWEQASPTVQKLYQLEDLWRMYAERRVPYVYKDTEAHFRLMRDMQVYPELRSTFELLDAFYRRVARDCQKVVHDWTQEPGSTVMAYQGFDEQFKPDRPVVNHFAVDSTGNPDGAPLHRNFILNTKRFDEPEYRLFRDDEDLDGMGF
ncbi:MAG: hypothetical protein AAB383_03510 [Patescibacteria group bacterium]